MRSRVLPVLGAAFLLLTGCMRDGRTLRDPSDHGTLSILPASTVPEDGTIDTLPGEDLGDDTDTGGFVEEQAPGLTLSAPWQPDDVIPAKYTCDGENVSPALDWDGVPDGTVEIAIELYDLDAPDYVHWIITGIDPAAGHLDEDTAPAGTIMATNSEGDIGYTGPCPPVGATHRYYVQISALLQHITLPDGANGVTLRQAIGAATLESTFVNGTVTG